MSTHITSVIANAKLIILDPHIAPRTPLEFKVDPGGAFEFKNSSMALSHFEITFDDPGPPGASKTLIGTSDNPIFVRMPHAVRIFKGHIDFKNSDGTPAGQPIPFLAHSCVGCT